MTVMVSKAVTDLYVNCSLQVRNFEQRAVCASDCCQWPAEFAVEMADGARAFRCREHKNIRSNRPTARGGRLIETGPVWTTIDRPAPEEKA